MADLKISQLTGATTPLAGTEVVPLVQSSSTKKVSIADLTAGRAVSASSISTTSNSTFNTTANVGWLIGARSDNLISAIYSTSVTPSSTNYALQSSSSVTYLNNPTATSLAVNDNAIVTATATALTVPGVNLAFGTAAKGINFTANTGAAGKTSQLFNWYEEGTFTPTVYGGTTAGTTTYVSQVGRYTRVGNVVYYRIYVDWSNQTGTGTLYVGGLPFTSVSLGSTTPGSVYANNLTFTANASLSCAVVDNTTTLFIVETVNNTGAGVVAVDTSASLVLAGMYFTS